MYDFLYTRLGSKVTVRMKAIIDNSRWQYNENSDTTFLHHKFSIVSLNDYIRDSTSYSYWYFVTNQSQHIIYRSTTYLSKLGDNEIRRWPIFENLGRKIQCN